MIKKILNFLLLILTLFSTIPYKVNADCGIGNVEIEAIISNKDGAKLYEDYVSGNKYGYKEIGKKLSYGDNIIILYESQGYALIEVVNDNSEDTYYIKASDYTYKSDMKAESESYIKYYAYADTIIRNVPSFYSYKIVTTVPANTFIDIQGNEDGDETYTTSATGWAAVSYNGKTGWVYVGGCDLEEEPITVVYKYENPINAYVLGNYDYKKEKFANIIEGYKILGDNLTKENINLKNGDKVKILYKHTVGHNTYYYVKTDSINGIWLYNPSLYVENDKNVVFRNLDGEIGYEMYSYDNLQVVNKKIEINKIYNYKYNLLNANNEIGYVIELSGKLYWIYYEIYSEVIAEELSKNTIKLNLENDYNYYSYSWFSNSTDIEGIISKGEYDAYLVEDEDGIYYIPKYGFISLDNNFIDDNLENDNITNDEVIKDNDVIVDEVISPKMVVTYCVAGAALVALGAAITIVIMHRNKKEDKTSNGE